MICAQRLVRRLQLAPEIRIFAGGPAVAVALHRAAALHTMDFPRQWMHLSQPRGACARMQHFLYALERSAADDRLMGIWHNDPIALRYRSHLFGFIADFFLCAPVQGLPYTSDPAGYGLLSCGSTAHGRCALRRYGTDSPSPACASSGSARRPGSE